jgi:hypothetical protein
MTPCLGKAEQLGTSMIYNEQRNLLVIHELRSYH